MSTKDEMKANFGTIKNNPVVGNIVSFFKKDGTEMTDDEIGKAISEPASESELANGGYGKDFGDHSVSQVGTVAIGSIIGGFSMYKLSGNKVLPAVVGVLAGAVIMHKIGPELITDIQRGNQYVDQQKALGKSEGKLSDRFNAVISNIKVKGQDVTPDPDIDVG